MRIRAFIISLRAAGLGPKSIARHAVTVRRLFLFLESEGQVKDSPMPNVLLPAASRKLPQTLSGDDIRKLLAQPDASRVARRARSSHVGTLVRDRLAGIGTGRP